MKNMFHNLIIVIVKKILEAIVLIREGNQRNDQNIRYIIILK